jgi:glycerol-3-phosphate cytidylyltransferase
MDILSSYPIDVRIIGEEYRDKQFTGHLLPMETYFNLRKHSFSTTELRQRVQAASNKSLPDQSLTK